MFAKCGVHKPHLLERQTVDSSATAGGVHQRGTRWLHRCSVLPECGRVRATAAVHDSAKASAQQRYRNGCSGISELFQHGMQRAVGEDMGPRECREQLQQHNDVHGRRAQNLGRLSSSRLSWAAAAAGPQSTALRNRSRSTCVSLQQVICGFHARVDKQVVGLPRCIRLRTQCSWVAFSTPRV